MAIKHATPYLILPGKAEEAIALYEKALGAKVTSLMRFGDMDKNASATMKNRVMHSEIQFGGGKVFISDGGPEDERKAGGTVNVALSLDDADAARKSFEVLAAKGKVVQPLMDAPWGSLYGHVTDQYGVNWMFDCAKQK
jgi:PhnB protein